MTTVLRKGEELLVDVVKEVAVAKRKVVVAAQQVQDR